MKNNLSKDEIVSLKSFCRSKPFKIVETDKNTGIAVLSHKLYDSIVSKNLSNDKVYDKIDNLDIITMNKQLKTKIEFLLE